MLNSITIISLFTLYNNRRLMRVVDTYLLPSLGLSQPLVPLVDEFAGRLFTELDYILVSSYHHRV